MKRFISQFIIALIILTGTAEVSWYLYEFDTQQIYSDFQADISKRSGALDNEMAKTRAALHHWKIFYEAAGEIQDKEFRRIARDVLKTYDSLQLIAWSPMVLGQDRERFEKHMQQTMPGYHISKIDETIAMHARSLSVAAAGNAEESDELLKEQMAGLDFSQLMVPMPQRPFYFPVSIIEPLEAAGFVGLDLAATNHLMMDQKIMSALATDGVRATGAIPSPFSAGQEPVVVAVAPVSYPPEQAAQMPPGMVRGFIVGFFTIEDMLASPILAGFSKDVNFMLVDETSNEVEGLHLLYSNGEFDRNQPQVFRRPLEEAFDRNWVIYASPQQSYIDARRSPLPFFVFVAGCIGTVLILLYLNLIQKQAQVVRDLVTKRTGELQKANEDLNEANLKLETLSRVDALTEVANRRFFNETLEREWNRALREGSPMALLLIDVDFFKNYNDHYGHLKGDEVLLRVATALKEVCSRSGDLVARYGGEEFAIILTNSGGEAMRMAEKCREAVESLNIEHVASKVAPNLTISVGLSSVTPSSEYSPGKLLESADKGLYIAKEHGRNRVIYHTCHGASTSRSGSHVA